MTIRNDMPIDKRILEIALMFAMIHIGDGDCLGEAARELAMHIKDKYPDTKEPEDFDC